MAERPAHPPDPKDPKRILDIARRDRISATRALAQEYEASAESIRRWAVQAQIDDGDREGLTSVEREELQRLRRENKELKLEREILKKAAAWFARETGSVPDRGSNS